MRLVFVPLALLALGCSEPRPRAEVIREVDVPEEESAPAAAMPVVPAKLEAPAPATRVPQRPVRELDAPLPAAARFRVTRVDGAALLEVAQAKALIALRRGDEGATGEGKATLAVAADGDVVVEITPRATLETVRAIVHVGQGPSGFTGHLAEAPVVVARDQRRQHLCAAHEDGRGGFTVVCRADVEAAAASVTADRASAGVFNVNVAGAKAFARLDFPAPEGDSPWVEAKMLTYNGGAGGVLVRAEVSQLAGEARPSFALASTSRRQPFVRRVFGCRLGCRGGDLVF